MNMKIAVFYYSQSGQALKAARNICKPLEKSGDRSGDDVRVVYKEIVTQRQYPFPWSKDEFFDVFPETRLGIPLSGIEPMDFSDINDADLVLVVGQSCWCWLSDNHGSCLHHNPCRRSSVMRQSRTTSKAGRLCLSTLAGTCG